MITEHIAIVIEMLETNPGYIHLAAIFDALSDLTDNLACDQPSGDLLAYQLAGRNIANAKSEQWLESTPLTRCLRKMHENRG